MQATRISAPRPSIAAAIPAYQAEHSIADVVRRALQQVARVVVVDDGSSDGTATAAWEAGASEVLVHQQNRGKGAAMRTALNHLFADGLDYVATLDADGQHMPEALPLLFSCVDQQPGMVLGVRDHLFADMGTMRGISNRISSRLISMTAGQSFADIQTGFRLYHRSLFQSVGLPEDGFEAESAVVIRACRNGFPVLTVPVEMGFADGRGTSHYRKWSDSLRIAKSVLAARMESKNEERPG